MRTVARMGHRVCGLSIAVALGALLAATAANAGSKPVITGVMATPSPVASGGTTTVTASVSGATSCTLSSNKAVPGLPATFSCESGSVNQEVVMPQNTGKKAAKYKLTLAAVGAGGKAKAKISLLVRTPGATSISVGGDDVCAVLTTGHVKCWGNNEFGETGVGKAGKDEDLPVEVQSITDAKEVAILGHACALLTTGHIECWGHNEHGELGDGTPKGPGECEGGGCSVTPQEVQGITNAVQIGAGASCALLSTGHVECWGNNFSGELGNGTSRTELAYSDVPVEVVGIANATKIAKNSRCALLSTGHVECWGVGGDGGLGDEWVGHGVPGDSHSSDIPVEALGITNAIGVEGWTAEHTCAVLSGGHIDCWGENKSGELGDGTDTGPESCGAKAGEVPCSTVPVEVSGIAQATQVAGGRSHSCALLTNGHVECWGANGSGQLGNGEKGSKTPSLTPVQVVEITNPVQIAAGDETTCALFASGNIKCWGAGSSGQLGFRKLKPTEGFSTGTPVEVVGL